MFERFRGLGPSGPSPDTIAYQNLLSHLTDRQRAEFLNLDTVPIMVREQFFRAAAEARGFYVTGSLRGRYLVLYKDNPNVIRLSPQPYHPWTRDTLGTNGQLGPGLYFAEAYCIYAHARGYAGNGSLPLADFILTLKLTIEFDEPTFLRTANAFGGRWPI